MILSILFSLLYVTGVICFFNNLILFTMIGGVLSLIENLYGVLKGTQNNLTTAILTSIISLFILPNYNWWVRILVGLCFEGFVMSILSLIYTIVIFKNEISSSTTTEQDNLKQNKISKNSKLVFLSMIVVLFIIVSMLQRKELHYLKSLPTYEEGYTEGYNDGIDHTYINAYNKGYQEGSGITFHNDTTNNYQPQYKQPKESTI